MLLVYDVVAEAMIDRIVHHTEVPTLTGDPDHTRARRELLAKNNRSLEDCPPQAGAVRAPRSRTATDPPHCVT